MSIIRIAVIRIMYLIKWVFITYVHARTEIQRKDSEVEQRLSEFN